MAVVKSLFEFSFKTRIRLAKPTKLMLNSATQKYIYWSVELVFLSIDQAQFRTKDNEVVQDIENYSQLHYQRNIILWHFSGRFFSGIPEIFPIPTLSLRFFSGIPEIFPIPTLSLLFIFVLIAKKELCKLIGSYAQKRCNKKYKL